MKSIKNTILEAVARRTEGQYSIPFAQDGFVNLVKDLGIDGRKVDAKRSILLDFDAPDHLMWELIGPYPNNQGYIFKIENKYGQYVSMLTDTSGNINTEKGITVLVKHNTSDRGWNGQAADVDPETAVRVISLMGGNPDKKLTMRDVKWI